MNVAKRSISRFFLLAFVLILPFWILGAVKGGDLLPGLPIAALATFCPMLAALILVYRTDRGPGVIALLKRSFDFDRIERKGWYAPILLIMPLVMLLSFWVLRLSGVPIPAPQFTALQALALFIVFFVGALGEELGWSGYAIDPMQERWGALKASLLLGAIWAVYHYVALVQEHRAVDWIAWWTVYTVAGRVIMVWLYNNTGKSVFGMALFHTMINVTWQLFPINGSYFDPRVTGSILAIAAVIVMMIWKITSDSHFTSGVNHDEKALYSRNG